MNAQIESNGDCNVSECLTECVASAQMHAVRHKWVFARARLYLALAAHKNYNVNTHKKVNSGAISSCTHLSRYRIQLRYSVRPHVFPPLPL